jgi:tetratricopeptide (TPR) repeat protein
MRASMKTTFMRGKSLTAYPVPSVQAGVARALEFHRRGLLTEAEQSYRSILSVEPDQFDATHMLGVIYLQRGQSEAAEKQIGSAIRINPNMASAHANRGVALKDLKRFDDALASFNRAISLQPNYTDAFINRGAALHELGRLDEAIASYDRAIALDPRHAGAFNNRGNAFKEIERFAEALADFDQAIALKPDYADAFNNRGLALHGLRRLDDALESYGKAIALNPRHANAFNNRANILKDLKRFDEALASYDRALALKPNFFESSYNRAQLNLLFGHFRQGWEDAEHRWGSAKFRAECRWDVDPRKLTLWVKREDLRGKRVLVVAEQGVGDEIMFASMIPDLIADAGSVAVECDWRLAGLFSRSFPEVRTIRRAMPPIWREADFDILLPLASLGRLYRNTIEDFPRRPFYLKPGEETVSRWRTRLARLGETFKVGISWKGGINRTGKDARSIALEHWRPLLETEGVRFVSLQYGEVKSEVDAANGFLPRPITRFEAAEIDDFEQLAGLVRALDLVISVQTALVHLSGAVGHPCLVMVPYAAEWRYGAEGETMPWYGSVKLHRQRTQGQWKETIAQVTAELAAARNPIPRR